MSEAAIQLCRDCNHAQKDGHASFGWLCRASPVPDTPSVDVVSGKPSRLIWLCSTVREGEGLTCSKFEEAPKPAEEPERAPDPWWKFWK